MLSCDVYIETFGRVQCIFATLLCLCNLKPCYWSSQHQPISPPFETIFWYVLWCTFICRAPTLLKVLTSAMQPVRDRSKHNSRRKQQGIILTMCKLMNIYNRELNGLAKVNGLRLLRAGVCRTVIAELNKSYDSVSYQTINSLLDSFVTKCQEKVKTWDNCHHCGDNVDKRI